MAQSRVLSFILMLFLNIIKVASNYPDETGGYTVVVAFHENIPEPENAEFIIENIKTSFEKFSENLWSASRNRFYVKSVDILIPTVWNKVNASYSIHHNYDTAAIRISESNYLRVENPFSCGKPGYFIEFPLSFFNQTDSGRYGPNWKAMLNAWASYRWGVWEEHGYPGDLKYPYSYKNPLNDEWEVTGCSNEPIFGRYMNHESLPCSASDTQNVSSTCRFIPDDQLTNATTSLMHFHWINSVVDFCDATNHNKLSPNLQNSMCDYKSVWEVIQDTKDFQTVTNANEFTIPDPIKFKIVQHSKKPRLYILLDRGRIQGPIGLATQIPRALSIFLTERMQHDSDTIAAVSSFPAILNEDEFINEEIDWIPIGSNLEKFIDVIGMLRLNGPLRRNFPQSIIAAAKKIHHPDSVVMLVIKYGADLSSFVTYPPQSEVIQALNERGIIFNAVELRIANHSGYAHLSELARKTGGVYTVISNMDEAQTSLSNVFSSINKMLDKDYKEIRKSYRTLVKTNVRSGSVIRFKVTKPLEITSTNSVEMYFSLNDGSLAVNNFIIEGFNPAELPRGHSITEQEVIKNVLLRKTQDWMEDGSKWTYFLKLPYDDIASYEEITVRTDCGLCHGTMFVRADSMDAAVTGNVTVSVYTNAENSTIDFSRNEPLIIFVKVLNASIPVVGAQVVAILTETNEEISLSLPLADNGDSSPDKQSLDGIYSGYFVPNKDGNYKISVLIEGNGYAKYSTMNHYYNASNLRAFGSNNMPYRNARLLPVDQQDMGCRGGTCDTTILSTNFMQSVDVFENLRFFNARNYSPAPAKILEFFVRPDAPSDTFQLIWIAPSVPGVLFSVSSYDIRQSNSKERLITDFENQEKVPGVTEMTPGAPGTIEILNVAKPSTTTFYAIQSQYRGRQSKLSDIQEILIKAEATPTTPSTTTFPTTLSSASTTSTSSSSSTTTSSSTTSAPTRSTEMTSGDGSSSLLPSSTTSITPEMPSNDDKKPWAKTGGGIAVITIITLIIALVIVFAAYFLRKMRGSSKGRINPPPQEPRTSIPS